MSGSNLPHYPQQQPQPPQGAFVGWQPIYAAPPKPPVSGVRVSAGIVAIIASLWGFVPASLEMTMLPYDVGFFVLGFLGALATLVLGIVQITLSRSPGRSIPTTLLSLSGFGVLVSVYRLAIFGDLQIPWSINLLLCLTVAVLSGIAMTQSRRQPKGQWPEQFQAR